jgi:hypothetical protein
LASDSIVFDGVASMRKGSWFTFRTFNGIGLFFDPGPGSPNHPRWNEIVSGFLSDEIVPSYIIRVSIGRFNQQRLLL